MSKFLALLCLVGTLKQANKYCELNRNLLQFSTGGRVTSWLFIKCEGVESGNLKNKFI